MIPDVQNIIRIEPASRRVKRCIALLKSCASSELRAKQIHAFSVRHGVSLCNRDMGKHLVYILVGLSAPMNYVNGVFTQLEGAEVFTWNTMIRGYAESKNSIPAMELYRRMHASSVSPDTHTYPFVLKAVSKGMSLREGEAVHCSAVKDGFEWLMFVQNSLVSMYAACGSYESAHKVFELMPDRDLVAWNSVMHGFAINGRPNEALTIFKEMDAAGVEPDEFTMVSLVTSCGELGALSLGRRVHVYLLKVGLTTNRHANNSLMDMYAKCGSVREALVIFEEMATKGVVSWTSAIVGLAMNGFSREAIQQFEKMEDEGLTPSDITFVGVLYACSHCGMVSEAFGYFERMKEHGIVPRIEHHGCMVDVLGRAGLVWEAHEYVEKMPLRPNAVIWRTLLAASTVHGQLAVGEVARARLRELEPEHSGDYVLLSNLYASRQRWADVHDLRSGMLNDGVKKTAGVSLVELRNDVHEFAAGDRSHYQTDAIYEMLEEIMVKLRSRGYAPLTESVLADIEDEEKEGALCYHSEKIAIAFMLVNTIPGVPIRVVKNLRVCADCHSAIKLISEVFNREIVVRDRSRFHHFRYGFCSCGDYW